MTPAEFLEHYQWFLRVTIEDPNTKRVAEETLRVKFAADLHAMLLTREKTRAEAHNVKTHKLMANAVAGVEEEARSHLDLQTPQTER